MNLVNQNIVVWFSCGAASAVAAMKTIDKYGIDNNIFIVNTDVKEEDADNRRFLNDVSIWLNHPIILASNAALITNSCVDVWERRKYMSGVKGAPCTKEIKKEARYQFESNNKVDWHVMGFTVEETDRHDRFTKTERENVLPVLIDEMITKKDCFRIIENAGLKLPAMYLMGYPNANCIGCVKATSPTYWNHVRKIHPEVFAQRAEQSRRIGCRLVRYKGKRIFLDELPPNAKGLPMKNLKAVECGIFCDTN